jgi:hypothetical protein
MIVGSLPTPNGLADTAQAACLIMLDSNGNAVETIAHPEIDGPWEMKVFVESSRQPVCSPRTF